MVPPIVTLTTDFGTADPYVGAMKGVIYGIHPEAIIVDISHDVRPHDLVEASYVLMCSYDTFPRHSLHVVVVDPGVGSDRRVLLATGDNYRFLAPDNGVLSAMFELDEISTVREVDAEHYYRRPLSPTFHGRDIFAPVAAWLSKGIETANFGEPIEDFKKFQFPLGHLAAANRIDGRIIHIDRFGNCVTNIRRSLVEQAREGSGKERLVALAGKHQIRHVVSYYAQAPSRTPVLLLGSNDFYEIALNGASAAQHLGIRRGENVQIHLV